MSIIDFSKEKDKREKDKSIFMFELTMSMTKDEQFEVYLEVNDTFTDSEIGEALLAAAMKFIVEHGLDEEPEE